MKRNTELLEQTMQYLLDHPEQHNQLGWMNHCGTSGCFAGHALLLVGVEVRQVQRWSCTMVVVSDSLRVYQVSDRAAEYLGLTREEAKLLFHENNTVPMLQAMVKDLVNGQDLRAVEEYQRAEREAQGR